MITIEQAKALVGRKLKDFEEKSNIELAIMDDETIEFEYGWVFFYQSQEFVRTRNLNALVGGNAPIIVDKFNSSIHITGTRMSEEFYIGKYCIYRDDLAKFRKEIS